MRQEIDLQVQMGSAFRRLEDQVFNRIATVIRETEDRVLGGITASEGRVRDDVTRGVGYLDRRIGDVGGYRYQPYVYPPAAGIVATPRGGGYLMADHGGGHSSGKGGSAVGGAIIIVLVAALVMWFVFRVLPCPNCDPTFHFLPSASSGAKAEANCPYETLKGHSPDGTPNYKLNFDC